MKRLPLTIFLLSITVLIIGAGCFTKSQKTTTTDTATTTAEIIKKKPQTNTPANSADEYCKKSGNELIIRFDQETKSSKTFCRFADTTECETEKYFKQTCAPGQGAKTYISAEQTDSFTVCTNEYVPVCGANGITYTNSCLIQTQGILLSHTGVCTIIEQEASKIETANTKPTDAAPLIETILPANDTGDPNWLPVVKSFVLSSTKSDPPAFIEKCAYAGNPVYYFSPGCKDCLTTLYNKNGSILCYPSNDLDNTCPAYFTGAYRGNYCTKLWKDDR